MKRNLKLAEIDSATSNYVNTIFSIHHAFIAIYSKDICNMLRVVHVVGWQVLSLQKRDLKTPNQRFPIRLHWLVVHRCGLWGPRISVKVSSLTTPNP